MLLWIFMHRFSRGDMISFLLSTCSGMGLLSNLVTPCSVFCETAKLFPKWLHYFTYPPAIYECSNFSLYILTHTCYYLFFTVIILVGMKRYLTVALTSIFLMIRLMMLNIASCTYCQYVYILWRNVYSNSLPIFNWVVILLLSWIGLYSGYKFLAKYMIYKGFLPFCELSFYLVVSCEAQKFLILKSNLSIVLFLLLLVTFLRNHCQNQGHKDLLLWFFLGVL